MSRRTHRVSSRLDPELARELEETARDSERTIGQTVRLAIREFLKGKGEMIPQPGRDNHADPGEGSQ